MARPAPDTGSLSTSRLGPQGGAHKQLGQRREGHGVRTWGPSLRSGRGGGGAPCRRGGSREPGPCRSGPPRSVLPGRGGLRARQTLDPASNSAVMWTTASPEVGAAGWEGALSPDQSAGEGWGRLEGRGGAPGTLQGVCLPAWSHLIVRATPPSLQRASVSLTLEGEVSSRPRLRVSISGRHLCPPPRAGCPGAQGPRVSDSDPLQGRAGVVVT